MRVHTTSAMSSLRLGGNAVRSAPLSFMNPSSTAGACAAYWKSSPKYPSRSTVGLSNACTVGVVSSSASLVSTLIGRSPGAGIPSSLCRRQCGDVGLETDLGPQVLDRVSQGLLPDQGLHADHQRMVLDGERIEPVRARGMVVHRPSGRRQHEIPGLPFQLPAAHDAATRAAEPVVDR